MALRNWISDQMLKPEQILDSKEAYFVTPIQAYGIKKNIKGEKENESS